jgi:hypothetical protein
MNQRHSNHQALVLVLAVVMVQQLMLVVLVVLSVLQTATNHHHSPALDMVVMLPLLVELLVVLNHLMG